MCTPSSLQVWQIHELQEHYDEAGCESPDLVQAIHALVRHATLGRVIAPSEAEATSAAYFAKTPLV